MRVASRVVEQRKTEYLRKLGNIRKVYKFYRMTATSLPAKMKKVLIPAKNF